MLKIKVINGPNLNLLGSREPGVYGTQTLEGVQNELKLDAEKLGAEIDFFQSNHEGALIDCIHEAWKSGYAGIIINPGAYTHYSFAIRDAISAINIPVIEVHISNIHARDEFRSKSVLAPACAGQISGLGALSYGAALYALVRKVGGV